MKKLILLLAILAFRAQAQSQKTDKQKVDKKNVPSAVTTAFNTAHPGITDVEWKKEGANYEAEYDAANKKDVYVTYDASGKLVRTKEEIASTELPATLMSYIKNNYKEDEARNAFKITDAAGLITYKVKIKGDHLIFDSNGNFMKKSEHKKTEKKQS